MRPAKLGLILPGGGARAAYQVGVLRAVRRIIGRDAVNPFPILSGTSAGGINAAVLASSAMDVYDGITRMERIWANFHVDQVMVVEAKSMLRRLGWWVGSTATAGVLTKAPDSLLDNSPLRELLERHVRFARIQQAIDNGQLHALGLTVAGYTSARSITYFQAEDSVKDWQRNRREGRRDYLGLDHLMATSAIPFVFPPVPIRNEYFGDGSIRQTTPLSAPIRLGAERLLVIGVRNEDEVPSEDSLQEAPTFGQIGGHLLDTLFSDGLSADLDRLSRVNTLLRSGAQTDEFNLIDCMVISPSVDLRTFVSDELDEIPRGLRLLLKGIGAQPHSTMVSFLMFERSYTRALIDLGFNDAMEQRDELEWYLRAPHGEYAS